jgi:hypothetical protein
MQKDRRGRPLLLLLCPWRCLVRVSSRNAVGLFDEEETILPFSKMTTFSVVPSVQASVWGSSLLVVRSPFLAVGTFFCSVSSDHPSVTSGQIFATKPSFCFSVFSAVIGLDGAAVTSEFGFLGPSGSDVVFSEGVGFDACCIGFLVRTTRF